jgi:hypothetical protein
MLYDGRVVRKNKYKIGDIVKVKDLKTYVGRVGHMTYRFAGHVGWHYKITFPQGQLTFGENSLAKVPVRRK